MASLMADLLEGRITPATGNACCNAGGKLLKAVEMKYKYGMQSPNGERVLALTAHGDSSAASKA